VQDGMALRRHAEAARLQFIGERFRAGHKLLIASICNKDYKQLSLIVNTGVKKSPAGFDPAGDLLYGSHWKWIRANR
jgi:hypothetical protein